MIKMNYLKDNSFLFAHFMLYNITRNEQMIDFNKKLCYIL